MIPVPAVCSKPSTTHTPTVSDGFGYSVALYGNHVLIGAPFDGTNGESVGQSHLFDATTGSLVQTFNDPTPTNEGDINANVGDEFGYSVAIDGNYVLIGAPRDDTNGFNVGQAHLFDATTGSLLHSFNDPTITSDGVYGDKFGYSVAIDGNHVLIGAHWDATHGDRVGQAHLFDANTGNLLQTFNDPTPTNADEFGGSVAIDGNHVLVGAIFHGANANIDVVGQAHLFEISTGSLLQTFNDPTPMQFDLFGFSVALDSNHVLIGASRDDINGPDVGQTHLFDATTGSLLQTFNDPTPTSNDYFGFSVALDGNHVLIGAVRDDTNGQNVGQAHLFAITSEAVPGDYSGDGNVSEQDFLTWRDAYGTSVTPGDGADGNGDGMVDAADYTVWRDAFEASIPAAANSTSVPEPISLTLISGLALGMLAMPRRS